MPPSDVLTGVVGARTEAARKRYFGHGRHNEGAAANSIVPNQELIENALMDQAETNYSLLGKD
ncbi:hypothetical protein KXD40_002011 [Peronospora effusa]|uniref:Uncharacterized protein n=1 Tax=Peronospora effusa TaxID=542832 RepID=A0A3M6VWJ7_9STRA|nr:hypothetical protein DD238_000616 [Peronospora effusa]RQM18299.1 hypothetical protein DD237_000043 [Peronospora effusa]UIZ26618.1 hypothetical protein KXD40_002011 [Peronospora effusa]